MRIGIEVNGVLRNTLGKLEQTYQKFMIDKTEGIEYENDFKYDFVVKSRTDTVIKTKLRYEQYDPNYVHYTSTLHQPDNMIADWLNFGGSRPMDVFMNTFSVFDSLTKDCENDLGGAWCNEILHKKALDMFHIKYQSHPLHMEIPRF
jgi:hypothetical protein